MFRFRVYRRKTLFLGKRFLRNRFQVQIPGLGRKNSLLRKMFLMLGFRKEDFVPSVDIPKEQVPGLGLAFREENFVPKEDVPKGEVPRVDVCKEQVSCSDSGFREEDIFFDEEFDPKEQVLTEQIPCADSGFRIDKKQFVAKLWMLILGLVFEECEMEENVHDKELHLDHLLQNTL
ncbi:Pvstp1 [Plasmodium coatneyi]|uniref:Pvstp1 n=1 Tax=Plasmodium coatneyi TaxID=208452 RepID=A0A1B1E118_9APIC|nr:Pvstp1 [Plasmodium coatneyi]ANQ08660.1 Pvstp1 [Plasmodium coatneyi]